MHDDQGPTLEAFIPRLDRHGGQERSTLEVLVRLARRGWRIRLFARSLEDWPVGLALEFRRVPVAWLRAQLLVNLGFAIWVAAARLFRRRDERRVSLTIGSAALAADVRVIQYLNDSYLDLVRRGDAPRPNARTLLHRAYQDVYLRWEAAVERWTLGRSRALIAIAARVADDLQARDLGQARVTVIHHAQPAALEPDDLPPAARTALAAIDRAREPIVLFVGALERKGISTALAALATVMDLPWRFWAVGDGDVARWRRQAADLGIEGRVEFFGPRYAMPFYPCADLFLLPSIYEPFGLVVAEAAMHGVTPLCSVECGAMELWPERAAWLFVAASEGAPRWGEALRRLLASPDERRRQGELARAAFARWSWDKATDAYERVLWDVLGAKGR